MLSTITFLPLLGGLLLLLLDPYLKLRNHAKHDAFVRAFGIIVSMITFFLSLVMWYNFDSTTSDFQFVEKTEWISGYNIFYALGVDGISLFFVILTAVLTPICIYSSTYSITKRVKEFVLCFLFMETFIIGSFLAMDLLMFYIFFEAVLIPMYLIIGIWGGVNRIYAAFKFFLYTLAGSVLLLIGIVYIYFQSETTYIPDLNDLVSAYQLDVQKWLWLAFFASFAVKVPMWPVHTWLPDAHVQAPTAGSVILAGILLKLGGYGFLRFSLPFFPDASHYYADFVFALSVIAVIYTSLVALMQDDMKKLIAYSSVAHMGYVTAGIFAFNQQGIDGAIFQMISHGIVSAALFMCVGVLYDRMHTKEIAFYSGVTSKMPRFALQFMIFMLASVGLPATSGFIGEITVLLATFEKSKLVSAGLATGMVLGAAYMLWLFARVMYGKITNPKLKTLEDLNMIEKVSFWPLSALVLLLGIYPNIIFKDTAASSSNLAQHIDYEPEQEEMIIAVPEEQTIQ